ncbi:MAG: ROK family protein [Prolixibacteraceae bacterium]|nr:ROK family protein [Prolixibacteraceae bacterium]
MKLVGVDISGAFIEAGLISDGKIIRKEIVDIPFDRSQSEVTSEICKAIEEVFDHKVEGIGIGVPGLVDQKEKKMIEAVHISGRDSIPLGEQISDYFNKPVAVDNNANCFAIGEKTFGKGKPYSNFVGVIMNTGFGAGIIINGRLYQGNLCGAGEFGKIFYKKNTIEAYASEQFYKDKGLDNEMVLKRAAIGDPVALQLFSELGVHIGHAVANILFALAPEAIIFGGSVSRAFRYFEESMHEFLDDNFPFGRLYQQLVIDISEIPDMGILGAATLMANALALQA